MLVLEVLSMLTLEFLQLGKLVGMSDWSRVMIVEERCGVSNAGCINGVFAQGLV